MVMVLFIFLFGVWKRRVVRVVRSQNFSFLPNCRGHFSLFESKLKYTLTCVCLYSESSLFQVPVILNAVGGILVGLVTAYAGGVRKAS